MCGLVGMAGFLERKHRDAMRDLFFLDTLRGQDSTGLTSVKRNREVCTRKFTVPGYEFIEYPVVDKAMNHADQLWMGHNRFRTRGDINKANAHPFEVLNDEGDVLLVGAHNGTLDNKFELEGKLKGMPKFDTDSELLMNLLVEAKDFKTAINFLKGAWSLTFWDATTNCLHLCRNDQRPMTYAYTKDKKVMVWASEAWMIVNACRRNGVELDTNNKGMSCYATLPDHLYTLEIPQERDKPLPTMVKEGGYAGAPASNFQEQHWTNHYWGERGHRYVPADEEEAPKQATSGTKETKVTIKDNVITIGHPPKVGDGLITGFQGEGISLKTFDEIKAKGCVWCGDGFEKDRSFCFIDEKEMVCLQCVRDSHPKGDCVRPGTGSIFDDLEDDEFPFDLAQKDSPEYQSLIKAAVTGASSAGQ